MTEQSERWTTPRLAEFVAAITGAQDEGSAGRRAVEWATEALEAELGFIVEAGAAVASVGFARGQVPAEVLHAAVVEGADLVEIGGIGGCRILAAAIELESPGHLVVARAGTDPFSREEAGLLRAAARSLTMTVRLLRALSGERALRDGLERRQLLLQRLALIQRGIARRAALDEVLETVASGARDLLAVEIAAVRFVDPASPTEIYLAASSGLSRDLARSARRSRVGVGVGGRAVATDQLVVIDDYAHADGITEELRGQGFTCAMAAPVHEDEAVIGAVVVASAQPGRRFTDLEKEMLETFADHASVALTDAKRIESMRRLAFHDSLTGLPNRALFLERLERALTQARRRHRDVAVLFLDLDRFKTVNDSLGHAVGDRLLADVGERLRGCLRDEDTAARLGGDEFAILMQSDRAGAIEVAERILAVLEAPFVIGGREVTAAASIGIALDCGARTDAGVMLRDADTAMYSAKSQAGGMVVFEQAMHDAVVTRLNLESELRRATAARELFLEYQPVVRLADSTVVGCEALVRWAHPLHGRMGPLDFIPLAEETGQVAALGRWILGAACAQARIWHDAGRDLTVSVNVSPLQLQDARFVGDVAAALAEHQINPDQLHLEITESGIMLDERTAVERLEALRDLGVGLAIDDFGTGQSSLAILRRLPVMTLKVDKMFVDPIVVDPTAAAFLETVVRMGSILSLSVVIEGIETEAQMTMVRSFGDVYGQGYHLARPMAAAAFDKLLQRGTRIPTTHPPTGGRLAAAH